MATIDEAQGDKMFAQVQFTIVPSDDLTTDRTSLLIRHLIGRGATWKECRKDGSLETLDEITHLISSHTDFPEYLETLNRTIPVVKQTWVTDSIAKGRLLNTRQYSPDPSQFFHDVIVSCGTLPQSDENAIIAGVIALGGQYSSPLTKIVTHVITNDLADDKYAIAQQKNLPIKFVLPHWFDHCLKLGKKIDERPYELPNPQILQDVRELPRINPTPLIDGALSSRPEDEPDSSLLASPSKPRRDLNAFKGQSIFLGADLGISEHLRSVLGSLIRNGAGSLTHTLEDADIYVGQYRESSEFVTAFAAGKIIANLSWLYNVINRNRWTDPLSKLLHYPVPQHGMACFKDMRISVSSYAGDARTYVQNLVRESGATFTKTMRADSTHLITAHKSSEKCDAAQEWGINIVNHLWLEESYAQCAVQPLSNPRYSTFPPCTNLGDVCCQTRIDLHRIKHEYIRPHLPKTEVRGAKRKLAEVAHEEPAKISDAIIAPSTHLDNAEDVVYYDAPTNMTDNMDTNEEVITSDVDMERPAALTSPPDLNSSVVPSSPTGYIKKLSAMKGAKSKQRAPMTDVQQQPSQACAASSPASGQENQVPSTGRASKMKALGQLHKQADDIALYEKEKKRKGGVVHGGRRSAQDDNSYEATKEGSDLSFGETQPEDKPAKKSKIELGVDARVPAISHRLMLTGDERWLDKPDKESADKIKLRQLGVSLTNEPKNVDILVAPKILRTRKFIVAIANAPTVVGTEYLDTLLEGNSVPQPTHLVDKAGEKQYKFKLKEALERAKVNKGKLFRGWEIYVTDDVPGGFATFQEIIEANGGKALAFRGKRRGTVLKKRSADDPEAGEESQNQGGDDELDRAYLVTGDGDADRKLWKHFQSLASEQNLVAKIMRTDWILMSALRQQIRYDQQWDWSEP